MSNKAFRKFVFILITFIGGAFGTLTGLVYSNIWFWTATISGIIGGFTAAKLYLYWLNKISAKGNKLKTWAMGSIVAAFCGILCITVIHGIMASFFHNSSEESLGSLATLEVIVIGEIIGTIVGAIAGGACSFLYVLKIMGKVDETSITS